ncbi:hypothetical protein SAMN05216436_11055 [bacterium A37T11]|nr:hypothetical protein SAMN05216436_11055 [bacterium A37T11]
MNEYKDPLEERENLDEIELKVAESRNFFKSLFSSENFSAQKATTFIPFFVFMATLGIVYIANRHLAEDNVRKIDAVGREVKVLSWEYKTLKADLMQRSTQTEVAKRVDTLGLKELVEPPKKLIVETDK